MQGFDKVRGGVQLEIMNDADTLDVAKIFGLGQDEEATEGPASARKLIHNH